MAGLIPESFIDELLNRVDIVEVINRRVPLKKAGKDYQACCPFHEEKTPSFNVVPQKQFFHCFGCGESGDAISFISKFHNLDFPEAVETLARDAGMEIPQRQESPAQAQRSAERNTLLECLERAKRYFQDQLRQHPQRRRAADWCKLRGISGAIASEFELGYAPPGWDNLATRFGTDEKARSILLKAGLAVAREQQRQGDSGKPSMYDRFRDRVVFPIRDSRGRTVGFGGRVLDDSKPKYLNSPETPVFQKGRELYGLYEARKSKIGKLLLVEGYMDVIALAQAGIRNAVATLGTATSSAQIQRMFRFAPEIVFCFDGDNAGRRAAWRALEVTLPMLEDGKSARFLFLPEGEDPDSAVRQFGADKFRERVDAAQPLEDFFFDHFRADVDFGTIEGKAALSSKAMPLIRTLREGVYRELMIERLAEIAGVDRKTLLAPITAKRDSGKPPWEQQAPDFDAPPFLRESRRDRSGRSARRAGPRKPQSPALVAIKRLLREPRFALAIAEDEDLSPLSQEGDDAAKLLLELVEIVRQNPNIDNIPLLEQCSRSAVSDLPRAITAENIEPSKREKLQEEFIEIIAELLAKCSKKLANKRRRDQLRARTAAKTSEGGTSASPQDESLPGGDSPE